MFHFFHSAAHMNRLIWFTLLLAYIPLVTAAPKTVVLARPQAEILTDAHHYGRQLLQLALQKSAAEGEAFVVEYSSTRSGNERALAGVRASQGIDVIWSTTNSEREKNLLAIPINLLKGTNEYRVLMIRKADEKKFSHVQSLEQLRKFKAGTGTHWQDTAILKANGLPYATSLRYSSLFKMLAAKRFDYISRGISEAPAELAYYANLELTVAPGLLLHYHLPIYFFVSRDNHELAHRIERGLMLAMGDGSFDELFFSVSAHQNAFAEIYSGEPKIIKLKPAE